MTVTHQKIQFPNAFGGITNTTLCGRVTISDDGMNVADEITCKLCKKILAGPYRPIKRWIGWKPAA